MRKLSLTILDYLLKFVLVNVTQMAFITYIVRKHSLVYKYKAEARYIQNQITHRQEHVLFKIISKICSFLRNTCKVNKMNG